SRYSKSLSSIKRKVVYALSTGRQGERAAVRYVKRRGFIVLETNWTVPLGEIDIIAQKGRAITIFEVKTRRADHHFDHHPIWAVDMKKRRKLYTLAKIFINQNRPTLKRRRIIRVSFEVIGVRYKYRYLKIVRNLTFERYFGPNYWIRRMWWD